MTNCAICNLPTCGECGRHLYLNTYTPHGPGWADVWTCHESHNEKTIEWCDGTCTVLESKYHSRGPARSYVTYPELKNNG